MPREATDADNTVNTSRFDDLEYELAPRRVQEVGVQPSAQDQVHVGRRRIRRGQEPPGPDPPGRHLTKDRLNLVIANPGEKRML